MSEAISARKNGSGVLYSGVKMLIFTGFANCALFWRARSSSEIMCSAAIWRQACMRCVFSRVSRHAVFGPLVTASFTPFRPMRSACLKFAMRFSLYAVIKYGPVRAVSAFYAFDRYN